MKDYPIKIYIAGKIADNPNYKHDFALLKERIQKDYPNAIILNPATLPEGMYAADYMRICFAMMDSADLIIFGPTSNDSKGANLEKHYCEYTNKLNIQITQSPEFVVHCPLCEHKPEVGCNSGEYFIIDSDTNCPVCGKFTKMSYSETELVNDWNIYAAVHYSLKRKRGSR